MSIWSSQPIHFFHLVPQQSSPLATISLFSVFMSLFLFCLLIYIVLQIPHISKISWYLSLSDWLISLSIIPSRSIHAAANGKISFLLWPSNMPLYIRTQLFFFNPHPRTLFHCFQREKGKRELSMQERSIDWLCPYTPGQGTEMQPRYVLWPGIKSTAFGYRMILQRTEPHQPGLYHSFFIHLSTDEHLGYFHSMAIVNNAAMKIAVHTCSSLPLF